MCSVTSAKENAISRVFDSAVTSDICATTVKVSSPGCQTNRKWIVIKHKPFDLFIRRSLLLWEIDYLSFQRNSLLALITLRQWKENKLHSCRSRYFELFHLAPCDVIVLEVSAHSLAHVKLWRGCARGVRVLFSSWFLENTATLREWRLSKAADRSLPKWVIGPNWTSGHHHLAFCRLLPVMFWFAMFIYFPCSLCLTLQMFLLMRLVNVLLMRLV